MEEKNKQSKNLSSKPDDLEGKNNKNCPFHFEDSRTIVSSNNSAILISQENESKPDRKKPKYKGENNECKNYIKTLENRVQELQAEIIKSRNHKIELKRRFLLAKTSVRRENRGDVGCLEDLAKKREEEGWSGSKDVIVSLQKKLYHLKNLVLQKEKEIAEKSTPSLTSLGFQFYSPEEGRQDLVDMERDYIFQNIQREKQDWVEDINRRKIKLEILLERNEQLEKEVAALRSELNNEPKEDREVVSISKVLQVQRRIELCLDQKMKLKNSLISAEASIKANSAETENIKEVAAKEAALLKETEDALRLLGCEEEEQDTAINDLKVLKLTTSQKCRENLIWILNTYNVELEKMENLSGNPDALSDNLSSRPSNESIGTSGSCEEEEIESEFVAEIRKRRDSVEKATKMSEGMPPTRETMEFSSVSTESFGCSKPSYSNASIETSESFEEAESELLAEIRKRCESEVAREGLLDGKSEVVAVGRERDSKRVHEKGSAPKSQNVSKNSVSAKKKRVSDRVRDPIPVSRGPSDTETECREVMKVLLSNVIMDFNDRLLVPFTGEEDLDFQEELQKIQVDSHLIACLESELLELSAAHGKKRRKLRELYSHMHALFDHTKIKMNQLLDNKSETTRESIKIHMLKNEPKGFKSPKRLNERSKGGGGHGEIFRYKDAAEVGDSKRLLQVLISENLFIKYLIRFVYDTIEDIDGFIQISTIKAFF